MSKEKLIEAIREYFKGNIFLQTTKDIEDLIEAMQDELDTKEYVDNLEKMREKDPNAFCICPFATEEHWNHWVAMPSFNDKTIIAYHKDGAECHKLATEKGYEQPVIVYVSDPYTKHIY